MLKKILVRKRKLLKPKYVTPNEQSPGKGFACLFLSEVQTNYVVCKGMKALKNPMGPKSYWSCHAKIQITGIKMKTNCYPTLVSLL